MYLTGDLEFLSKTDIIPSNVRSLIPPGAYVLEKGLCREAIDNSSQDEGITCKVRCSCIERCQAFQVSSLRIRFELFQFFANPAYILINIQNDEEGMMLLFDLFLRYYTSPLIFF